MPEPTGPTEHLDDPQYWKDLYFTALEVGKERTALLTEAASLIMAVDTVDRPHDGNKTRGEGAGETRPVVIPDYWFDNTNDLLARIRAATTPGA